MSSIIIGTVSGGVLTPNARLTYNSDGTITGEARYACPQAGPISNIGSAHPDDSRAFGVSETVEYDEVYSYVSTIYRGVWSGSAVRVDVQASLQSNPIETHPNFVSTLGGTPAGPLNGAVFDPTTGVFQGWPSGSPDALGGVRFYLVAANTYRFTFCTTSGATVASAISGIGGLASSISAGGLTVTGANAFMLQNVTVEYEYVGSTTVYTYSVVWVSTQPPGWNTHIYPP
jgi:hypothetical protein